MSGRLFHPTTVQNVALVFIVLLIAVVGHQFDRSARAESPRGDHAGFPVDDAWIHQVYARSLATTGRLDYNPGDAEAGQSSLLYGALLAPLHWISSATDLPIGRLTRAQGVLYWILLALVAAFLVRSLPVPGAPFGSVATALLIGLDPSIAYAASSGMEPLLTASLMLGALLAAIHRRLTWAGVACGLSILARPESVIAAPFVFWIASQKVDGESDERPALPRLLKVAIPAGLIAIIWPIFCLSATGDPLPNTWYVKGQLESAGFDVLGGLRLLSGMLFRAPSFVGYAGFLFLFLGVLTLMMRVRSSVASGLAGTLLLTCVGVSATRHMALPDAFFWERYLIPVLPFVHIITGLGLAATGSVLLDLLRKPGASAQVVDAIDAKARSAESGDTSGDAEASPDTSMPPAESSGASGEGSSEEPRPIEEAPLESQGLVIPDPLLAILLLLLTVVPFASSPQALLERLDRFAEDVACVDSMNVAAAEFVRDNLPDDVVVLAQDAGAVRYFGERRVVDLIGLNDHALVEAGRSNEDIGPYLQEQNPGAFFLIDPDPGAALFQPVADALGMRRVRRFQVERYSPFLEETPRSIIVLYKATRPE